jgi:membrane protease YdiL (CAAX protease family)
VIAKRKEGIMATVKAFIESHPVLTYFVLTFAISWGCILMVVGPGGIPMTTEQLKTVGPLVYMATLTGPSVAGLLLTGLIDGRAGFRELLSRLIRWPVGVRWVVIALLATPLLATALLLALSLFSPEFLPALFTTDDRVTLLLTGIAVGLMVGIFEELGWTGFAIPRLRLRYGVLATGLIVGVLWGGWHFIVFWQSGSFSGALPLALLLAQLFSWLPAYRVLMVWVYDRTQSLLVVMLTHASLVVSTAGTLVPLTLAGMILLTWILVWAAALWVVVAAVAAQAARQAKRA